MSTQEEGPRDDIRAGYAAAIQLAVYEGQLAWRMLGAFAAFNSIIMAVAAYPLVVKSPAVFLRSVSVLLSLVGVVWTLIWVFMVVRSRNYYAYWLRSARELEGYLDERVRTLQRGHDFIEGNAVTVANEVIRLPGWARFRIGWGLYAAFLVFFIAYGSMLGFHIYSALRTYLK